MATLTQGDSAEALNAVISFRVPASFKKSVDLALVERGWTLRKAGPMALAQLLEIALPGEPPSVAEFKQRAVGSEQAGEGE